MKKLLFILLFILPVLAMAQIPPVEETTEILNLDTARANGTKITFDADTNAMTRLNVDTIQADTAHIIHASSDTTTINDSLYAAEADIDTLYTDTAHIVKVLLDTGYVETFRAIDSDGLGLYDHGWGLGLLIANGQTGLPFTLPGANNNSPYLANTGGAGNASTTLYGKGAGALDDLSDNRNVYMGADAGMSGTSANNNVFVGYRAGDVVTTGTDNVFIGSDAGGSLTGQAGNTFVGYRAGVSNNASNNTFIGKSAGYSASGSGNVHVGKDAGYNSTGSNQLYIDNSTIATPLIYGEFDNDHLKVNGEFEMAQGAIADNDATPDVAGANTWIYAGSANSVTVTDLDNPEPGVYYTIIGNSDTYTITVNDGGNFHLENNVNFTMGQYDLLILYCVADNTYIEVTRKNN